MNRDKKGRFSGTKLFGRFVMFPVVVFVAGYIVWSYDVENDEVNYTAPVVQVLEGIDAIAARPDIKRQQELIVKEAYVKEEKAKTLEAKKKAIAEFDAELAGFESELELIRKEKTTF